MMISRRAKLTYDTKMPEKSRRITSYNATTRTVNEANNEKLQKISRKYTFVSVLRLCSTLNRH